MKTPLSTPRVLYEHRQAGWAMLALACAPTFCLLIILASTPPSRRELPPGLLPGLCIVTAIVLVGFTSLSVLVTRDHLIVRFGIGLVRRSIGRADIVDVEITRTRWYEGWGIHWTRRGMLYSVAGFDAVTIRLASGRRLTIGSDEAPRLAAAIRRAIAERHGRAAPAG